jgi:hypothetical protein
MARARPVNGIGISLDVMHNSSACMGAINRSWRGAISHDQRRRSLMTNLHDAAQDDAMNDPRWSYAEKNVARQAFDAALQKELSAVLENLKRLAAQAKNPQDLWAIKDYLTEQRQSINAKYDYRYSQLTFVFGRLLREKRIEDKDLEGLAEEKLRAIRQIASQLSAMP